jgi:hypothetical protein
VYLSVYLIRIYSGKFDAPFIDNNLLILLGISIASPLISNVVSGYKYSKKLTELDAGNVDYNDAKYSFNTMLFENSKPALFRYQMFLWTFIGVFIFLSVFAASLYLYTLDYVDCREDQGSSPRTPDTEPCRHVQSLKMPSIDMMLVTLMGLSQSGFIGGKIVARTPTRITRMFPGLNNKFIILGMNFGDRNDISSGTILINGKAIAGHSDPDVKWFDTKIEFTLPEENRNNDFTLELIIDDVIFILEKYPPRPPDVLVS